MSTIITSLIAAGLMILIAALISNAIKFEGGKNPKDPGKRRIYFWVFAILNPVISFVLMTFAFAPVEENDYVIFEEYVASIPISIGIGFVAYIIIGFILSKAFKHGKLGHWF